MIDTILCGDAIGVLKTIPSNSVDMCMTSPPYYALRDYGIEGQIGLEPTPQEYISHLCDVFDEVKRVLKPTGSCWVVMGDTYGGSPAGNKGHIVNDMYEGTPKGSDYRDKIRSAGNSKIGTLSKCLLQMPSRFGIEMCDRGWILRNEVVWYKRSCIPSSVKDRFTVDFEKIFFFVKNKKYYFEQQVEPSTSEGSAHISKKGDKSSIIKETMNRTYFDRDYVTGSLRNKRCVWDITPKPFKGAHFAIYPPQLCFTPIKAGCPEFICKECGKPRTKVFRYLETPAKTGRGAEQLALDKINGILSTQGGTSSTSPGGTVNPTPKEFIGYTDCGCNAGWDSGIVLDCFSGSGTTCLVAKQLGRHYIGIDLNPEYVEIAKRRLL